MSYMEQEAKALREQGFSSDEIQECLKIDAIRMEHILISIATDITLSFAGVTPHGIIFLAEAVQTCNGWSVSVCLDGTNRGCFESSNTDLRAALSPATQARFA